METAGGYYDVLAAQIAYWIQKYGGEAEAMAHYRKLYRTNDVTPFIRAVDEGKRREAFARSYRLLGEEETLSQALPRGASEFRSYNIRMNVFVEVSGEYGRWVAVVVSAVPSMTRQQIEDKARQIARDKIASRDQDYNTEHTIGEQTSDVVQTGGIEY